MARRRYISTKISLDKVVNRIAITHGDFAALFYSWGIPHAEDDATLYGDPEELLMQIMPGRRDKTPADIEETIGILADNGLVYWDKALNMVQYPVDSFYEYQTYISVDKRRPENISNNYHTTANNAEEQRKTPTNASSLSPSPSVSPNTNVRSRKRNEYTGTFEEFWKHYPRGANKAGAFKAWMASLNKGFATEDQLILSSKNYAAECKRKGTDEQYIMHGATFLGPDERWKDHLNKPQPEAPKLSKRIDTVDPVTLMLRDLEPS